MSKFTDRLKRLHASRVRALDDEDDRQKKGVFHADETNETDAAPAVEDRPRSSPERTSPPARDDSPARRAVRDRLRRGERLKSEASSGSTSRRKLQMRRDDPEPSDDPPRTRTGAPVSDNRVGERLAELRVQAEALISVGAVESALPMLHEMLALAPDNPYPLGVLVRYWRSRGDETLARLYEVRLQKTAPY